ncbi:MAG: TOMM precursor leader peptide-binding protein, partial [Gemmatimonadetes bacterium]|nr:TOMM precursor leader peptide-binding protein [Gemmatimonadota bacterium]
MTAEKRARPRPGILARTTAADRGIVKLPALTPHLRFHEIGEGRVLLVSESFNTLLHGKLYGDLLPLLDGRHSEDEIVAALEGAHAPTDVLAALAAFAAKGYLVSADHGMDLCQAAYWSSLGASPRWAEEGLAQTRVTVEGDDGRLVRHLEEAGASVGGTGPTLTVVVCADYLDAHLAEVNRRQLEARAPWTLVRPGGMEPLFGPIFRADGRGPCWDCLACRLRSHREVHGFLRNVAGEEAAFRPFAAQPAVLEALYGLIAAEIVKWLVLDESAPIHNDAITMDIATFTSSRHRVVRRPQCAGCGDEALRRPDRPPLPVSLKASPKAHRNSGGMRAVSPGATLAKYRHLVSPVSGVVTWLSRTTDETDSWLHVYWAGSNPGMRSRSLSSLRRSLRSKSAGKGS